MTEIEKLQQELFQIIEYIERNVAKINQNTWKVYVEQISEHLGDARIVIDELKASSSNTVAPVDNKIIDALELNQAWSILHVLDKMIEDSTILLDKKDYDGHGWEEIHHARQRAREIYSNLTAALKEQTNPVDNIVESEEKRLLNLAQAEIRAMYKRVGIIGSNILSLIDNYLEQTKEVSTNPLK